MRRAADVTAYQRTHRPTARVEVLCASRKPLVNGLCPDCGRSLERGGRDHRPDRTGVFGWIEWYADGSYRIVPGDKPMPVCRVCEQTDVPASHRTPLGYDCDPESAQRKPRNAR